MEAGEEEIFKDAINKRSTFSQYFQKKFNKYINNILQEEFIKIDNTQASF